MTRFTFACLLLALFGIALPANSRGQNNLTIYDDQLENGWTSQSTATVNFASTTYAHTGSQSIQVTITAGGQTLYLHHSPMDTSLFSTLTFWVNGGMGSSQVLTVSAMINEQAQTAVPLNPYIAGGSIAGMTWRQVTIPLADLGAANSTALTGLRLQDASGTAQRPFWVDDISLVIAPINVGVNASQTVRVVDDRLFGVNAVAWDWQSGSAETIALLQTAGTRIIRLPGGSLSDDYLWVTNMPVEGGFTWGSGFDTFSRLVTGIKGQAFVTVNYGTGTPEEAAAWVAYANASATLQGSAADVSLGVDANGFDWKTAGYWSALRASAPLATDDGHNFLRLSRSSPFGLKWWEIGNECYGTWEEDHQPAGSQWNPAVYATRAQAYIAKMKSVDPTIRTGVVAVTGEDTDSNGYTNDTVTNPRTGVQHNGWTPVLLTTLKTLGVTPDYLIYHRYEQAPGAESDAVLLQDARTWPNDAANLRQQLSDYLGAAGASVELCVTENNSVYTNPGKQSTSLVNGLFYADSLGNLLQTEFNSLVWWDLRNGQDNTQNNSSSLYGWRLYGDYGVLSTPSSFGSTTYYDAYPTYYMMKLISHFVRGGDQVVSASSDSRLLSVYAAKHVDGSLGLLVINKSPNTALSPTITLTGIAPQTTVTVYSYGISQDNAAETGSGSPDIAVSNQDLSGSPFVYSFPAYSATVMTMTVGGAASATSPQNQAVAAGQTATFTVTIAGTPVPSCQWQYSPDGGSTWTNLGNNGTYSGVGTTTLTVANAGTALNGYLYRCLATNTVGTATSSAAALTVLDAQALVQLLFQAVLQRPADAGGITSFEAVLAAGSTPSAVLGDLFLSAEYGAWQLEPAIRLYYAALARMPDYTGLQNWSNALHAGALTLTGAADQFAASAEFVQKYGSLDDTGFVQQLYLNVLGRPADPDGLTYWVGQLNNGASRGTVLVGFSESDEFKADMVNQVEIVRLYFLLLHRMPNAAELSGWISFFNGDGQTDTLFTQAYPYGLSDADYVQAVFQGFLCRAADAGALSSFTAGLANGTITHGSMVDTVLNSAEFSLYAGPVSRLYLSAFQRVPDQAGLNNWVSSLQAGNTLQSVADYFAASQEFQLTYGTLNDTKFVTLLYQNVLGRAPDPDGLNNWLGLLSSGSSRGAVLIGFSQSTEAINLFAPQLRTCLSCFAFFNAQPTPQQLAYWSNYLATLTDQLRATLIDEASTGS